MPNVVMSTKTIEILRQRSVGEFVSQARYLADGKWVVPVDEDVFDFFTERTLPGETMDEVIQRFLLLSTGLN